MSTSNSFDGKRPRHTFEDLEPRRVRSEVMAKGIIDLDVRYTKPRSYQEHEGRKSDKQRMAQGDQADELEPECNALRRVRSTEIGF